MRPSEARVFTDAPAVRDEVPLIIGLTGPSSSGKTYTALTLATGVQKVRGGDIYGIDAESGRMKHYAEFFQFRHVPFAPPYGPADYQAAIDHCVNKGARIVVVDSMSHEHDGEGGVLDQIAAYLDAKAGDDWKAREKLNFVAQLKPKTARKALNRRILQLPEVTFILCYRAQEKIKPRKGQEPDKLGWQPITTSPLSYEMTVRFLLGPGAAGVPSLTPETEAEKLAVKLPRQFQGWFDPGKPLTAAHGERLATWALGNKVRPTPDGASPASSSDEFTSRPAEGAESRASSEAVKALLAELEAGGLGTGPLRKAWIERIVGHPIASPAHLTTDEWSACMDIAKEGV